MKKYIVGQEEQCLYACKTRADAEELILLLTEEAIYINWLWGCNSTNYAYQTPKEYINWLTRYQDSYFNHTSKWSWMLQRYGIYYWIEEVEEI